MEMIFLQYFSILSELAYYSKQLFQIFFLNEQYGVSENTGDKIKLPKQIVLLCYKQRN